MSCVCVCVCVVTAAVEDRGGEGASFSEADRPVCDRAAVQGSEGL